MKHIARQTLACLVIAAMFNATTTANAASPAPSSWEVSGEFNHFSNQTGNGLVWHYGWKPQGAPNAATVTLMLAPHMHPANPPWPVHYRAWQKASGVQLPLVGQGIGMAPWTTPTSLPITLPARGIGMHPGYQCEWAVVRFTAPTAAQYRVSGQFYGLDSNGTGTQTSNRIVANSLNNTTLHSGNISLPNQGQSSFTSKLVMLQLNGTLDFQVGCGPNNNYQFGTTGLHAVIERTAAPYCEPKPNIPPDMIDC